MNSLRVPSSVLATNAFVERPSYGFVSTEQVLNTFAAHGWKPVSMTEARVNKQERQGFQKHLIRLENDNFSRIEGLSESNTSRPQLVVLNSHDGTSSLQILWGLIRIACLNGIIAGTGLNGVRLVHSASVVKRLPEGIDYMLANFSIFQRQIQALQGKRFTDSAVRELILALYDARLKNVSRVVEIDYSMPNARRLEDTGHDAYTVFNRIQEVMVRGGIKYTYEKEVKNEAGEVVDTVLTQATTRRVASISSQVKLNQLTYDLAIKLAA